MAVSRGERERTCVKVFHINISEVENEVNKSVVRAIEPAELKTLNKPVDCSIQEQFLQCFTCF